MAVMATYLLAPLLLGFAKLPGGKPSEPLHGPPNAGPPNPGDITTCGDVARLHACLGQLKVVCALSCTGWGADDDTAQKNTRPTKPH